MGLVKNGCCQSGHKALKLAVSQNEQMEQTCSLHAGTNSGKLKGWFNNFWMGVVKNVHDLLFHETLKSPVS